MIRVSVLYPAGDGKRFDHRYYSDTHMPMAARLLDAVRHETDRGISAFPADMPATYVAIGHFYFHSLEDFHTRFAANVRQIVADVPNYTDITPTMQISEIL